MYLARRFLAVALLGVSLAAVAQTERPAVGSVLTLGREYEGKELMDLRARLYAQIPTGREVGAQRQALDSAMQATAKQCRFTTDDEKRLPRGQSIYSFTVEELQELEYLDVRAKTTTTHLWARLVNRNRSSCAGWHDQGIVTPGQNSPAAPVNTGPIAAGQPPGFFCPTGWMANPSGKPARDGSFRCFADKSNTIPAGYQCPAGMTLDKSGTDMLTCKAK